MKYPIVFYPRAALVACFVAASMSIGRADTSESVDAAGLMQAAVDTARGADSLSADITYSVHVSMAGMNQDVENRYRFVYGAPNKVALVMVDGMSGQDLISDGNEMFVHIPMLESYTVSPAPEEIGAVLEEGSPFGGELVMVLQSLMTGKAAEQEITSLGEFVHLGSETVDDGVLHNVRFHLRQSDLRERLGDEWREGLDPEELALFDALDFDLDIDLSLIEGENTFLTGVRANLTELMKQMAAAQMGPDMGEMELEMAFVMSDWKVNDPPPDDAFVFEPPAGTQRVDDIFDAIQQQASGAAGSGDANSMLGEAAPDFELALLDGDGVTLSDHLGKDIVIIDFWATWCGPCIQAMPALLEVASDFKDRDVVFYAVNLREDAGQVRSFIQNQGWDLIVPMDPTGAVADAYGVTGIPHTVIVGKGGQIEKVHVGFSPALKDTLTVALEDLLAAE